MKRYPILLFSISVSILIMVNPVNAGLSEMRGYMLGDIDDGIYNGTGSVDDVYFDPDWYNLVDDVTGWPMCEFDKWESNRERPFTFLYELNETEEIIAAELILRIQAVDHAYESDFVYLESLDYNYSFNDLGWIPLTTDGEPWTYSGAEFVSQTLDLSNILGDNLISFLQDGQLNVLIQDDCVIDYAILNLEIIPVPSTLILGIIGIGCSIWKFRRK
jgi:hypothetical protein